MRGNRPHKVDRNQREIVRALRQIPEVSVFETHMVGKGFPDIICGYKGVNRLYEIKVGDEPLTLAEECFFDTWKGQVEVITSVEDALYSLKIKVVHKL